MCNLYSMTRSRAEAAALARAFDWNNNQPPMPGIYPDYAAPVVFTAADGSRQMRDMRWGMPSSKKALLDATSKRANGLRAKGQVVDDAAFKEMLRVEPDKGTTNIRNVASPHWKPYLGPKNRCLAPFTSFSEPDQVGGTLEPVWFAHGDARPLSFFAGLWTPWAGVRKIKTGWEEIDVYGFLTTEANAEVRAHHDKAMPVILTSEAERDLWLSDAPWEEVKHLQRPLPDGALGIVARGVRQDDFGVGPG
jgi:putative SOS response-associated peptidase YedK